MFHMATAAEEAEFGARHAALLHALRLPCNLRPFSKTSVQADHTTDLQVCRHSTICIRGSLRLRRVERRQRAHLGLSTQGQGLLCFGSAHAVCRCHDEGQ